MLGPRKDPAAVGYKQRSGAEQSLRREPYITHSLHPERRAAEPGERRRCKPESHQNLGSDALARKPRELQTQFLPLPGKRAMSNSGPEWRQMTALDRKRKP